MNITPRTTFVLVNQDAGEDVTPDVLTTIAKSIDHALAHAFREAWGGSYACRAGDPTLGPDEVAVSLEADSDVRGAAGYHDDGAIHCFRDGLPELLSGPFSFSVVISHEIWETIVDPGANRWVDTGQSAEVALEAADAVEGFSFLPDGQAADVSDFLLPSFFDPTGARPFSHCDKPTAPFTTATDDGADYQITRTVDENGVTNVTATTGAPHPRTKAKACPTSRTSRRGATLATRSVSMKPPPTRPLPARL